MLEFSCVLFFFCAREESSSGLMPNRRRGLTRKAVFCGIPKKLGKNTSIKKHKFGSVCVRGLSPKEVGEAGVLIGGDQEFSVPAPTPGT